MDIVSFQDLVVWQKSIDLVELVYAVTKQLPPNERYGLIDQMRRAAISIPSNIAEGCKRNNRQEYRQFCGIAQGSSAELQTQLLLTQRLYVTVAVKKALMLLDEIQRMLTKLIRSLRATS